MLSFFCFLELELALGYTYSRQKLLFSKKLFLKIFIFSHFFRGSNYFLVELSRKSCELFISPPCGTFWAQDFCAELQRWSFCQKWILEVRSFATKKFQAKILSEKKIRTFFVRGHRIFEAKNRPCAGPPGLSRALARAPGSWIRTTPRLGNVCFFDYNLF